MPDTNENFEQFYQSIESKLRAMEYSEPLGIDSVPLVDHLLSDLLFISESREKGAEQCAKLECELFRMSQQIVPLQKENTRLSRENSSLHLEMIHQTEHLESKERHWYCEAKRLEGESKEKDFLFQQQTQRVEELERELELLRSTLSNVIMTEEGINVKKKEFLRQEIDLSTPITKGSSGITRILNDPKFSKHNPLKTASVVSVLNDNDGLSGTSNSDVSTVNSPIATDQLPGLNSKEGVNLVAKLNSQVSLLNKTIRQLEGDKIRLEDALKRREEAFMNLSYKSKLISSNPKIESERSSNEANSLELPTESSPGTIKSENAIKCNNNNDFSSWLETDHHQAQIIHQLTHQVDYLTKQVSLYEKKYQQAITRLEKYERILVEKETMKKKICDLEASKGRAKNELAIMYNKIQAYEDLNHEKGNCEVGESVEERLPCAENTIFKQCRNCEDYISQIKKLEDGFVDYEDELQSLRKALDEYRKNYENLIVDGQDKKKAINSLVAELDLSRKENLQRKKISDEDEEHCKAQEDSIKHLQGLLLKEEEKSMGLDGQVLHLETIVKSQEQDSNILRMNLENLQQKNTELENLYKASQDANREMMASVQASDNSKPIIDHLKQVIQDTSIEHEQLFEEVHSLRRRLTETCENYEELSLTFDSLTKERNEIQQNNLVLSEESKRLKEENGILLRRKHTWEEESEDLLNLQIVLKQLEVEKNSLSNRLMKAEDEAKSKGEQLGNATEDWRISEHKFTNEKQELLLQIERLKLKLHDLENRFSSLKQENEETAKALLETKEKFSKEERKKNDWEDSALLAEKEKQELRTSYLFIEEQLPRLKDENTYLKEQLQKKVDRIETLMKDRDQLESSIHDSQKQERGYYEKLRQHERTIQKLQENNSNLQTSLQSRINEIDKHTSDLEHNSSIIHEKETEVNQLKNLVTMLESSVEDLKRNSSVSSEKHHQLSLELSKANQEIEVLRVSIEAKDTLLHRIDSEKDRLENVLDEQTEQLDKARAELEFKTYEIQKLKLVEQENQGAAKTQEKCLKQVEADVNLYKEKYRQVDKERNELSISVQTLEDELRRVVNDLDHMTKENQILSSDCVSSASSTSLLKKEAEKAATRVKRLEESLARTKIDNRDLRMVMKSMDEDRTSLYDANSAYADAYDKLSTTYKELVSKSNASKDSLSVIEQENRNLKEQINSSMQHIDHLTRQLSRLQSSNDSKVYTSSVRTSSLEDRLRMEQDITRRLRSQVATAEEKILRMGEERDILKTQLEETQSYRNNRVDEESMLRAQLSKLRTELALLKTKESEWKEEKRALTKELHNLSYTPDAVPVVQGRNPEIAEEDRDSPLTSTPLSMEEANRRCLALEKRLKKQAATVEELEASRDRFHDYAIKYEEEIEKRDQMIHKLRSESNISRESGSSELGDQVD